MRTALYIMLVWFSAGVVVRILCLASVEYPRKITRWNDALAAIVFLVWACCLSWMLWGQG